MPIFWHPLLPLHPHLIIRKFVPMASVPSRDLIDIYIQIKLSPIYLKTFREKKKTLFSGSHRSYTTVQRGGKSRHTAPNTQHRCKFNVSILQTAFSLFSPSSFYQLASISAFRSQKLVNLVHFAHSMFKFLFSGVHEIILLVAFCVACTKYFQKGANTRTHTRKEISQFRIS